MEICVHGMYYYVLTLFGLLFKPMIFLFSIRKQAFKRIVAHGSSFDLENIYIGYIGMLFVPCRQPACFCGHVCVHVQEDNRTLAGTGAGCA